MTNVLKKNGIAYTFTFEHERGIDLLTSTPISAFILYIVYEYESVVIKLNVPIDYLFRHSVHFSPLCPVLNKECPICFEGFQKNDTPTRATRAPDGEENPERFTVGPAWPATRDLQPPAQAERNEQLARLAGAIRELPQRDRVVLILYYERDLTMKEVAQVLGVTESRVSQVHASALFKLSMKLGRPT